MESLWHVLSVYIFSEKFILLFSAILATLTQVLLYVHSVHCFYLQCTGNPMYLWTHQAVSALTHYVDSLPVRFATCMQSVSLKLPHSKDVCVFVTAGSTQSILYVLLKPILGRSLRKCHSECRRYFPGASVPSKEKHIEKWTVLEHVLCQRKYGIIHAVFLWKKNIIW